MGTAPEVWENLRTSTPEEGTRCAGMNPSLNPNKLVMKVVDWTEPPRVLTVSGVGEVVGFSYEQTFISGVKLQQALGPWSASSCQAAN